MKIIEAIFLFFLMFAAFSNAAPGATGCTKLGFLEECQKFMEREAKFKGTTLDKEMAEKECGCIGLSYDVENMTTPSTFCSYTKNVLYRIMKPDVRATCTAGKK